MRISPVKFYTPAFKAHSYKIEPKSGNIIIQTDNEPNLGEKPYLIYDYYGTKEVEMKKENGLESTDYDEIEVTEKEFGAQDIEGGFSGDDIYLWQTRNIPSAYALNDTDTKFLNACLAPDILAAKQSYLKNPTPETYNAFEDAVFHISIKSNLRVLLHELSNSIFTSNSPLEEKYIKIKERLHLCDKFLEHNPKDKVNKLNPIDMTSVFKTLLAENNCKGIKMKGLECLKDVMMGDNVYDVYYGLVQLINFAQQQTDNKNITLSFDKDDALYAIVTYKGKQLSEDDFYNAVPRARKYDDLNPVTASSNGDFASIRLRLNTLEGFL